MSLDENRSRGMRRRRVSRGGRGAGKPDPVSVMPFGKHGGKRISDLPWSYLIWLADQPFLVGPLRESVDREVDTRIAARRERRPKPASPIKRRAYSDFVMPFGKYQGQTLNQIDLVYLRSILKRDTQMDWITRDKIESYLMTHDRTGAGSQRIA